MIKHKKITWTFSRILSFFYKIVWPVCTIILLLVISQNMNRPLFLGSFALDLMARIWIGFSYCYVYIILSNLERYNFWIYGIKRENLDANNTLFNWRNIALGVMFGTISTPLTWWVIQFFLPTFKDVSWFLAILHGFLLSIPIIVQRNKFTF